MLTPKILLGFTALLLPVAFACNAYAAEAGGLPMANPANVAAANANAGSKAASLPAVPSNLFTRDVTPPDVNTIPILANMIKGGVKLYYLGQRSNLNGWFIVQNGEVQMIYVTTDNKTAIVGGMFTSDGDNVTAPQVEALSKEDKEIEVLVNGGAKPQPSAANTSGVPGLPPAPSAADVTKPLPAANAAALSPGERLLQDMQNAAGVVVGANADAQLYMVIDPNCPHCQATWRELRDAVFANKLQVRLVPIGNISPESTRAAAQLLKVSNPLDAWDKYVAGDKKQLDGVPLPASVGEINANRELIGKWNITATPYLVYRGKDGRVKIVQGKPERMAAVLSDLLK